MSARMASGVALGLRVNRGQFLLLVAINAFVGAMVGLERTVLPLVAERDFGITSAVLASSFVASFGLAKACTNLGAGYLASRLTRRRVLILGWLFALPVPLLIIWAPAWHWVVAANALLGINQGLTWSMTVNMKVDLVGPARRGLALGANETAGYVAVALAAFASGAIAEQWGVRPAPFYLGVAVAAAGLALSALFVRDTEPHVRLESSMEASHASSGGPPLSFRSAFAAASWRRRELFGLSQAGFVTNLNDALAWAIFPLYLAAQGRSLGEIALVTGIYPLVWGVLQVPAGWLSDATGRRPLIVTGMLLQAMAIAAVAAVDGFEVLLAAAALLGLGKALVYPTLLAAVGDAVRVAERATVLGVYRFWRDGGAMAGALLAGMVADRFGFAAAILLVAALTGVSGIVAAATVGRGRSASGIAAPYGELGGLAHERHPLRP